MNRPDITFTQFVGQSLSLTCLCQDDLLLDNLKALVEPINISYLKKNNFNSLQISYYTIQTNDTIFKSNGDFYKLTNDSTIGQYWSTQRIKSDSKAKNYYKEDRFGNLYIKSATDGKEYPSTYTVKANGKAIWEKNQTGKRYFFYNNDDQLIKTVSDTFNLAPNRPFSINEYEYKGNLLIKKTRSVYDSDVAKPTTSDTLLYSYNDKGVLVGYSHTKYSSFGFMGAYSIIKYSDGLTIDLIQTDRGKLTRYKFGKKH